MHLQLRDQQLKTISYVNRLTSKLQGNCKPKICNRYTNKKNQLKYNSEDGHQTTRGEEKGRKKSNTHAATEERVGEKL